MIAVTDITGLFIMPLAVYMHNVVYDIFNQLGMIFIPFVFVIVSEFYKARTAGADNGNAAVLYVKNIEVTFIKKFFILMLFVMPATTTNATYSFKQFSQNSFPSILSGAENVSDLNPNTNFNNFLGQGQAPLAFGLINNIAVGLSNSLVAKVPCTTSATTSSCIPDVNVGAMKETLENVAPNQEENNKSVAEFAEACYNPALASYLLFSEDSTETVNLSTKAFPDNSGQKFMFFSDFMNDLYLGDYGITGYHNEQQLWITTSESWSGTSVGSNATIKCQDASLALYESLNDDLINLNNYDHIDNIMKAWVEYFQRYGGDLNEIVATNALAKQEVISSMYINSYRNTNEASKSMFDNAIEYLEEAGDSAADAVNKGLTMFGRYQTQATIETLYGNGAADKHGIEYWKAMGLNATHIVTAGMGAADAYSSAQIQRRVFPVQLQIASAALFMFSPIVLLLSGYSSKVTYRLTLFYIALCFSPYAYELGQAIGNNLIAAAADDLTVAQEYGENESISSTFHGVWLGYYMPIIMVAVWNILIAIASGLPRPFSVIRAPSANIMNSEEVRIAGKSIDAGKKIAVETFKPYSTKETAEIEKSIKTKLESLTPTERSKVLEKYKK